MMPDAKTIPPKHITVGGFGMVMKKAKPSREPLTLRSQLAVAIKNLDLDMDQVLKSPVTIELLPFDEGEGEYWQNEWNKSLLRMR